MEAQNPMTTDTPSGATTAPDSGEDWTADVEGRSNSSPAYLALVREVERLIRSDAHQLIQGRADLTARLIVSMLAHGHGLAPLRSDEK